MARKAGLADVYAPGRAVQEFEASGNENLPLEVVCGVMALAEYIEQLCRIVGLRREDVRAEKSAGEGRAGRLGGVAHTARQGRAIPGFRSRNHFHVAYSTCQTGEELGCLLLQGSREKKETTPKIKI